jgi:hypothetical protein
MIKEQFDRFQSWLLRTLLCAIWIVSVLLMVFNCVGAMAEVEAQAQTAYMIHAGGYAIVFITALVAHAYLIVDHRKKYPPKDEDLW